MADEPATPEQQPTEGPPTGGIVEHDGPVKVQPTRQLRPRQRRFAEEYLIDLNATQAAIRAGYSPHTANEQGSYLLAQPSIRAFIEEEMAVRSARVKINADRVIRELGIIAFASLADYKISDDGEVMLADESIDPAAIRAVAKKTHRVRATKAMAGSNAGADIIEVTKDITLHDKVKALQILMAHLGELKQPTPASEVDPVRELFKRLPAPVVEGIRALLETSTEQPGVPAISSEPSDGDERTASAVPAIQEPPV